MIFSRFCAPKTFTKFSSIACLLLISLLISGTGQRADAKPLNKKECKELKKKIKTLKTSPTVANMEKGFEWVKENIKGDDLLSIKEFIETEEQFKFRCPQPKKKKSPKPIPKPIKKEMVEKDKKKKPIKKKSTTKKKTNQKTKKNSKLEIQKKSEPSLFEALFPSSLEEKAKTKS